jgi:ribosomal protein L37AE/L43A
MENKTKRRKQQEQEKHFSQSGFCQVCDDKASIVNYGALTCQSCKTFFRRNGFHPEVCSL